MAPRVKEETAVKKNSSQDEMERLQESLLRNMPTKLELKTLNSKTRIKHMEWERKNLLNVIRWRELRKEAGFSTNLESIRPDGFSIAPNQSVKGSEQE